MDGGAATYLSDLKPIVAAAAEVRTDWLSVLARLRQAADPALMQQEAVQAALDRSQRFRELRRKLATLGVPPELADMHRSVDGWLAAMGSSCDAIVQATTRIDETLLGTVGERLRAAGVLAEKFNSERAALAGAPASGMTTVTAAAVGARRPLLMVLAAVAAVALLIGVLIVSLGQVGNEPVPPDVLPVPGLVVERKVFPQAEVLGRLRQEVLSRTVQIRDVDVRLEAPDRIVIPGKVLAPTGSLVGVTIELQIAADAGKPKITPIRVSAVGIGISVPQAATDAVTKRADEANKELANQVPAGQTVRRLFIENNAIVVELEVPAAVGTGTPQAQTPKPGA